MENAIASFKHVPENLRKVLALISRAAERSGRVASEVKLVAVSKTFPLAALEAAYAAGQRSFGENRVQELADKFENAPKDVEWHLIGHLQTNKASKAAKLADVIHSVDSPRVLEKIAGATEPGRERTILLEVNISGESTKYGVSPGATEELAERALANRNVKLGGLMTMAPFGISERELRGVFSSLRVLRDSLEVKLGITLPELSMGMSSDFEQAIQEGATMVRVGTAIFGTRTPR